MPENIEDIPQTPPPPKPDLVNSLTSESEVRHTPPGTIEEEPKSNPKLIIIILIFLFVGTLIAAAYFLPSIIQKSPEPSPSPASASDGPEAMMEDHKIEGWLTYSNSEYSFQYPPEGKTDSEAAGEGAESTRVTYMGEKQIASGRTQTELFDGYSFVITKLGSLTDKTLDVYAQEEKTQADSNCADFEESTVTTLDKTSLNGAEAYHFLAKGCYTDYTEYVVASDKFAYRVTLLTVGEEVDLQTYNTITDQILSTFQFN